MPPSVLNPEYMLFTLNQYCPTCFLPKVKITTALVNKHKRKWIIQRPWQHWAQETGQRQTKHKNVTQHRKLKRRATLTPPKTHLN
jgi:hypothetical protein